MTDSISDSKKNIVDPSIDFTINQHYEHINDNVHGLIYISNLAIQIVNDPIFQRLRKLKQLGSCEFKYPCAVHNRFVHSIGTYYLADRLLKCILCRTDPSNISEYLRSIPELQNYYMRKYDGLIHILDDYVCELIKIAALCHDLGHGPFSHVFDDYFLPYTNKTRGPNDLHETRSGILLEMIIKNNSILRQIIKDPEIQFIKNLINPSENHIGFLYQIVSNNLNGVDVDKYDYIARDTYMLNEKIGFDHVPLVDNIMVIDNNICYPENLPWEVFRMFRSRHDLHQKIYCEPSVISCQLMLVELFNLLDPILHISDSVNDMVKFCELNDNYIMESVQYLTKNYCVIDKQFEQNIKRAVDIVNRINNHNAYAFIGKYISDTKININTESLLKLMGLDEKYKNDLIVFQSKIGYVSGNKKSPLTNLYTCSTRNRSDGKKMVAVKVDLNDLSHFIPKNHQENITMVFYRDHADLDTVNMLRESFDKIKDSMR